MTPTEEAELRRFKWRRYYWERRAKGWKRKWKPNPAPTTAAGRALAAMRKGRAA